MFLISKNDTTATADLWIVHTSPKYFPFLFVSQLPYKQQLSYTAIERAQLTLFCTSKSQPVSGSEEILNVCSQTNAQANLFSCLFRMNIVAEQTQ